jgi:hypothetical protein
MVSVSILHVKPKQKHTVFEEEDIIVLTSLILMYVT